MALEFEIEGGAPVWVAGCMSGTSLDGVDVALIKTDGTKILGIGDTYFRPYSDAEQAQLRAALGSWEAPPEVCELIETAHAEALSHLEGYDLIGFHGQTLAHDPANMRTHQAGDGAVLAEVMGKPVVWDFRSSDVQLGGQGAPLAPFYHHAMAKFSSLWEPVAFLNLGGVGNLTWVDAMSDDPAAEGTLLAFDTGPANAPINDAVLALFDQAFDAGGALAAKGKVSEQVLSAFAQHPYFFKMPPKSLDRNSFSGVVAQARQLEPHDAVATLTAMAAAGVARAMEHVREAPSMVFACGGGRKNATLMAMLRAGIDCPVEEIEALGFDGDFVEAQAFGYLAARVLYGLPTSAPGTTGVSAAVGGGRVSRPSAAASAQAVCPATQDTSEEDEGWDF